MYKSFTYKIFISVPDFRIPKENFPANEYFQNLYTKPFQIVYNRQRIWDLKMTNFKDLFSAMALPERITLYNIFFIFQKMLIFY